MTLEIVLPPVEGAVDEALEVLHPAIPVARAITATATNEARALFGRIESRPIGAPDCWCGVDITADGKASH